MAERPAFFADNHFRGPVQKALRKWADVIRTVDLFGEKNDDEELLSHAAKEGMVFLTSDEGIHTIANTWFRTGRMDFRMIYCRMELHREMTDGEIAQGIEDIMTRPNAFTYPIEYVKPRR